MTANSLSGSLANASLSKSKDLSCNELYHRLRISHTIIGVVSPILILFIDTKKYKLYKQLIL